MKLPGRTTRIQAMDGNFKLGKLCGPGFPKDDAIGGNRQDNMNETGLAYRNILNAFNTKCDTTNHFGGAISTHCSQKSHT